MIKSIYFCILLSLLAAASGCLSGCSKVSAENVVEAERKNIIVGELKNTRKTDTGAFDIQSVELLSFKSQPVYSLKNSYTEQTKAGNNYSQIETMYDGYGNKTESRCLENDPLLRCVVLKTSAAGQKQAIVYGKNGEVKNLSDEMLDKAMTDETANIAAIAGIFEQPKVEEIQPQQVAVQIVQTVAKYVALSTPEVVIAAQKEPTVNEIKPDITTEEKPQTKPVQSKGEIPVKIKVDSLWLNNLARKTQIQR